MMNKQTDKVLTLAIKQSILSCKRLKEFRERKVLILAEIQYKD